MLSFMSLNQTIYGACLGIVCIAGDRLVNISSNKYQKAVIDNLTHALIGLFTAMIFCFQSKRSILRADKYLLMVTCLIVSSIIDIDHFIVAKSWKLTVNIKLEFNLFDFVVEFQGFFLFVPGRHKSAASAIHALLDDSIDFVSCDLAVSLWTIVSVWSLVNSCFLWNHVTSYSRRNTSWILDLSDWSYNCFALYNVPRVNSIGPIRCIFCHAIDRRKRSKSVAT